MKSNLSNNRMCVRFTISILFLSIAFHAASAKVINIDVSGVAFEPSNVTAEVGDVIHWRLAVPGVQTTTCDGAFPGTFLPNGAAPWDQNLNGNSPDFRYTITASGTYHFVSKFHTSGGSGTIIAEEVLPVELTDFVATTIKNEVILDWVTGGETNNDRFEIQRIKIDNYVDYGVDDMPFITVGYMKGNGTIDHSQSYKFIDRNLESGTYIYRLRQVDFNSNYRYHLLNDEVHIGLPSDFVLMQNYPNPFNPVTRINYELPEEGTVKLLLIDISGRETGILMNENRSGGYHSFEFNGSGYASGVYYYRIEYQSVNFSKSSVKKLVLLK